MRNPAPVNHPVHELIRERWSPRAFSDRLISKADLATCLEAARWAPSSYNEQPWGFLVATRDEEDAFAAMLQCLVPFNRSWARNAAALMVTVARRDFESRGAVNPHARHDVGLAVGQMTLQAQALGITVHQMAGVFVEETQATYEIPETHEVVTGIALGYPGDPQQLADELRERETAERHRKAASEIIFSGRWGQAREL